MKTRLQLFLTWKYAVVSFCLVLATPYSAIAGKQCTVVPQPGYERNCGALNPELLKTLNKGQCFEMEVKADSPWNLSGIRLENGETYKFEVKGEQPEWTDGEFITSPEGWSIESLNEEDQKKLLWIQEKFIEFTKKWRREPNENWFHLIGFVATVDYQQFPIGLGTTEPLTLKVDGEFCAFANDLHWKYDNNTGSLQLKVTRLE